MDELKDVKLILNPTEVLLVVDAMTGQEAAGTLAFTFYDSGQMIWLLFELLVTIF